MEFYLNDVYPNMGTTDTRTNTIPDADDRNALAETGKAVENATVKPKKRKNMVIGAVVLIGLIIVLGVAK